MIMHSLYIQHTLYTQQLSPAHSSTSHSLMYSIFLPHVGTPGATPYGGCALHLNQVEANMVLRCVRVCVCMCV